MAGPPTRIWIFTPVSTPPLATSGAVTALVFVSTSGFGPTSWYSPPCSASGFQSVCTITVSGQTPASDVASPPPLAPVVAAPPPLVVAAPPPVVAAPPPLVADHEPLPSPHAARHRKPARRTASQDALAAMRRAPPRWR